LQIKHLEHTLETHVYSHCNNTTSRYTFAISIYNTCNISLKYLKHLKYTLATCTFQQNLASGQTEHCTARFRARPRCPDGRTSAPQHFRFKNINKKSLHDWKHF
jgi:hypothetical protein